jgi:hypothetical protein
MGQMTGLNAKRSAAVGCLFWLLLLLTTTADTAPTELIHKIVFFAILVIVPLGLPHYTACWKLPRQRRTIRSTVIELADPHRRGSALQHLVL